MKNMFTKEKVIDMELVNHQVERKKSYSIEQFKKELIESKEVTIEQMNNGEIDIEDLYVNYFVNFILTLNLDELEYINANNLYEFDKNNSLDNKCQKYVESVIAERRQVIADLEQNLKEESVESYFQKFGDLDAQTRQASNISVALGIRRENIELTPLGEKLKNYINNLYMLKFGNRTDSNSKPKR